MSTEPPLLPAERAGAIDDFAARLDQRLAVLVASHHARWSDLAPIAQDWLGDVLRLVLVYVRADVLALVRDLLTPPTVH